MPEYKFAEEKIPALVTVTLLAPPVAIIKLSSPPLYMPVLVSFENFIAGEPTEPSGIDKFPVRVPPDKGRKDPDVESSTIELLEFL